MRIALSLICILFGAFGWVAQFVSAIHYPLAQRLGLQEKTEGTDALFRIAELSTARWDVCVLWTLPLAGILMLVDHHWWPYVSLIAGGIYLDTAGREAAKMLSLRKGGVRVGSSKDLWIAVVFFSVMAAISLAVIFYGLWYLGMSATTPRA
jgi:hypothetical protein